MNNITLSTDRLHYLANRQTISTSCKHFRAYIDKLCRERADLSDAEHAVISELMSSLKDVEDVFDIF